MKFLISLFISLSLTQTAFASCDDVLTEVFANGSCTKIKTYKTKELSEKPLLLIALHGDSPFNNPSYQYFFAKKVVSKSSNMIGVGMLRPGYEDQDNRVSDGVRGDAVGDNYDKSRVAQIAEAITKLKQQYQPHKVVLAGHSGGSAITANLTSLYPDLIDHAVIVSCPCDVKQWREDMFALTKEPVFNKAIGFLSPADLVDSISEQTKVSMFVGADDPVTKPYLSKAYRELLRKKGNDVSLEVVEGKHDIFLSAPVVKSVVDLIDDYNKTHK